MKIKVSITGASGFVGQNLIGYLDNDLIAVRNISRDELHHVEGLTSENTDVIIHLAGKAHDLKKVSDPDEYYKVNLDITKNLYDSFLKSDASKFIFISSVKAVADEIDGVLNEDVIAAPGTHYGKSKRMAEEYIMNQTLPDNKSYYILRPCMIHGPGNKGNLNLLYQVVKRGIPYPLAGFDNKRSFLSVENLCFAISEIILREDIASGIYHVADDEALSTNKVVEILSAALNIKARLWRISPELVRIIAKIGDKLNLPLTTERLNKLTENYVVSNNKLNTAIGKTLPLSSKEGLKITADSFKNPTT